MNASFTQLRSGLILTSGGVHELEAAGVTLDRAIRPGIDVLTPAMSRASASTQGARMAMRGLGEETALAQAIEHGWADSDHMKEDEDLATLRDERSSRSWS